MCFYRKPISGMTFMEDYTIGGSVNSIAQFSEANPRGTVILICKGVLFVHKKNYY